VNPMAIRLALVAHHYRADWEWTDDVLVEAHGRLERWRAALAPAPAGTVTAPGGPAPVPGPPVPASVVLAAVRERLADDLDAPGAVAAVDAWADSVLAAGGTAATDADLVRDTVDALLGVVL
jgi:L-cysteine:1D-myo-inositol 2-amino-2-deoxy-alpha-D-glucopyranoside ligase